MLIGFADRLAARVRAMHARLAERIDLPSSARVQAARRIAMATASAERTGSLTAPSFVA